MAFKRSFRRSFRRKPLSKVFAKKRRTWVVGASHNSCERIPVQSTALDDLEQCGTPFSFIALDNSTLQSLFSDRATVVRIVGDMWCVPLANGADNAATVAAWSSMFAQIRMGLVKRDLGSFGGAVDRFRPLTSPADYAEGRWRKMYQHQWQPDVRIQYTSTVEGGYLGCCPNVTGSGGGTSGVFDNTFTEGTGTINIDDISIETDCGPCVVPAEADGRVVTSTTDVRAPALWHCPLGLKCRIPMRENEYLTYEGEFAAIGGVNFEILAGMEFNWAYKLLVEY